MRRLFAAVVTLACFASAPTLLLGQPSPPPDPSKIQVLILTGQHVHDWRGTTPLLKKALEGTGRFEVRVNEEFRGAGPETLAPYDLVVVNYYNRGAQDRWGDRANAAIEDFVRSGKGLVLYHLALGAFDGWTEYGKGRVFVTTLGHGPDEVVNQGFVVTFSRGAEWAATGKVTLPLPAEMRK